MFIFVRDCKQLTIAVPVKFPVRIGLHHIDLIRWMLNNKSDFTYGDYALDKFYLADKEEFKARAAVQKARSLLPNVQRIEAQEAKRQEPKNIELARIELEQEKERLCHLTG